MRLEFDINVCNNNIFLCIIHFFFNILILYCNLSTKVGPGWSPAAPLPFNPQLLVKCVSSLYEWPRPFWQLCNVREAIITPQMPICCAWIYWYKRTTTFFRNYARGRWFHHGTTLQSTQKLLLKKKKIVIKTQYFTV